MFTRLVHLSKLKSQIQKSLFSSTTNSCLCSNGVCRFNQIDDKYTRTKSYLPHPIFNVAPMISLGISDSPFLISCSLLYFVLVGGGYYVQFNRLQEGANLEKKCKLLTKNDPTNK